MPESNELPQCGKEMEQARNMTVDPLAILVGVVGIGVVVALLPLVYKSESIKNRDRVAYAQKIRPYLLALLGLTAALAVGLVLVTDLPIALGLDLGLLVLAVGAIMMYLRPRGITEPMCGHRNGRRSW